VAITIHQLVKTYFSKLLNRHLKLDRTTNIVQNGKNDHDCERVRTPSKPRYHDSTYKTASQKPTENVVNPIMGAIKTICGNDVHAAIKSPIGKRKIPKSDEANLAS
jgi:hypothetical protein